MPAKKEYNFSFFAKNQKIFLDEKRIVL